MQRVYYPDSVKANARNSNLELLRIVSMFMVLFVHYLPTRMIISPDSFRLDFWNTLGQLELVSIGFQCVNCFVLISGYFGIRWKVKSFSKLLYTILFWALVAWATSKLLSNYFEPPADLYSGSFLAAAYTTRWFIGAYLCLYILAPIINSFIEHCTTRQLGRYIVLFYVFSSAYGWLMHSGNFNEGMSELSLIGVYATGAYLKRSDLKIFSFSRYTDLAIFFGLSLVLTALNAAAYFLGTGRNFYEFVNPIILVQSIYLFLFFKKMDIGYVPWINFVAASAFSAYLFHHHQYVFPFFNKTGELLNGNCPVAMLAMTGVIFGIFLFCSLADVIGNRIFDLGFRLVTGKRREKVVRV